MIAVSDLTFSYPGNGFRLRVPSLQIDPGQRVAIIGPSGSGKTTLLNLLAGIARPQTGIIRVDGRDVSAMSDAQRRAFRIATIGMVFQEFELLEYLRVVQNILLPYRINRSLRLDASVRQSARDLADSLGVGKLLDRYPQELSQGERQRVAICRALIAKPRIIFADEPTGNLDPQTGRTILRVILDESRARGALVLMVTHDHSLLDQFDRVVDVSGFVEPAGVIS